MSLSALTSQAEGLKRHTGPSCGPSSQGCDKSDKSAERVQAMVVALDEQVLFALLTSETVPEEQVTAAVREWNARALESPRLPQDASSRARASPDTSTRRDTQDWLEAGAP